MARSTTLIASTILSVALLGATALAQNDFTFPRRFDPELRAAQLSLETAVEHLQKTRNAKSAPNVRALAYIALAQTELQSMTGGGEGFE